METGAASEPVLKSERPISIKRRLTLWLLAALVVFLVLDTTVIYQNTLQSINVAFDRTLLASARAIGDTVNVERGKLTATLPYATLEVFEAVTRGRIVYRVNDFDGKFLSGYPELPPHNGEFPKRTPYAALLQPVYVGEGAARRIAWSPCSWLSAGATQEFGAAGVDVHAGSTSDFFDADVYLG